MNKLIVLSLLIFVSINLNSQCYYDRKAYEAYYEKNFADLDIIEGFWSVTVTLKVFFNGELVNTKYEPQAKDWAIIKDQSDFKVCDIYFENSGERQSETQFSKTANPLVYFYKRYNKTTGEITKANAVMSSIGILEYSYEVGIKELKTMFLEKYKSGLSMTREFKWIKTYPIKETYQQKQKNSGTGFAISSDGLIATCNHIIENSDKIFVKGVNNDFNKYYYASLVATDKNNDLAIIRITDTAFKTLGNIPYTLSNKTVEVGSSVFVLGYPLRGSMGEEIKLTNGIISSKSGFKGDITSYQISAPVQPGNSGGPLFDDVGNIVGVINAKFIEAENVGYAIKSIYLINILETFSPIPDLPKQNTISIKTLPDKVKSLKNFTYIIETN